MTQLVRGWRRAAVCASLLSLLFVFVPARAHAQGPWTGAGPDGGMVRTIVIAPTTPQTSYAGTGSGVFRRVGVSGTWTLASDGLENLDIWSLAFDASNPAVLLAGTSAGVFKTSNGGTSWVAASTGLPSGAVLVVAIDPTAALVAYAGTSAGVYKTTDGGSTWQSANNASAGVITSLAVDPLAPGTVYASNGADIFKTVDGGATWETRNSGLEVLFGAIETIAVDPLQPGAVLTAKRYTIDPSRNTLAAAIFRSTDGAASWSRIRLVFGDLNRVFSFAFDPAVTGRVFVGTGDGVKASSNGGGIWSAAISNTGSPVLSLAVGRDTPWILWAGSAARGVIRGDYAAGSLGIVPWFQDTAGLTATATRALAVDSRDPDTVYAIDSDLAQQVTVTSTPTAFRSWDGGQRWAPMGIGAVFHIASAVASDPRIPGTVYAGTTDPNTGAGFVYRSADAGVTWSPMSAGVPMSGVTGIVTDPMNPGTLYALAGTILKTENAGGSWRQTGPATGANGPVSRLALDPLDSNILYASAGSVLYRSANAGASWQTLQTFSGATIRAVAAAAIPSTVYVATSQGVFSSGDGGVTFTDRHAGLPAADVTALVIDPLQPLTLYAGTSTAGVFRTADGATTWRPFNEGLRSLSIATLAAARSVRPRIYAGTARAGVHSRALPAPSLSAPARAIPALFRPSSAQWFGLRGAGDLVSMTFGDPALGDLPVPADYDGDGLRDIAVFRATTNEFFVLRSSDGVVTSRRIGDPALNDQPVPADYDGDGKSDLAILRPSLRTWLVLGSATGALSVFPVSGPGALLPAQADYDGDGRVEAAFCERGAGALIWTVRPLPTGPLARFLYGDPGLGDVPQPADYDGDGKADTAVYRQTTGQWFIFSSTAGQLAPFQFGSPVQDDIPVAGDYDGDGRADVAVYRKSTGEWFWFGSTTGFSGPVTAGAAAPGDIPLTGVR